MQMTRMLTAAVLGALAMPAIAQDAEVGAATYSKHCATCHGIEATGHGPMAGVLLIKPTDLTQLKANNDGVLPVERIVKRIDGRDPLVSHGSPMPVYGDFFQGRDQAVKARNGQPILTSAPIVDLLTYIETLQTK